MADLNATAPSHAGPSRTVSTRHDIEGAGKFKLGAVNPRGNGYKAKFHVLRERYDSVTARHEDLRKELELANAKLRKLQNENDLLLDAMQIVVPSQPGLLEILDQIEPLPEAPYAPSASASSRHETYNGNGHAYVHEHINGDSIEHDTIHPDYPPDPAQELNGR